MRRGRLTTRGVTLLLWMAALALSGCAGSDPLVALEIRRLPAALLVPVVKPDGLLVSVGPFEDARAGDRLLGRYHPIWGKEILLTADGGDLGDVVAQVFATYLKNEQGWRAWFGKSTVGQPDGGADVRLSGQILECEVRVRNWALVRWISVRTRLAVEVANRTEAQPARILLAGSADDWFFSFDPRRGEEVVTEALLQAFQQFTETTKVLGTALRQRTLTPVPAESPAS